MKIIKHEKDLMIIQDGNVFSQFAGLIILVVAYLFIPILVPNYKAYYFLWPYIVISIIIFGFIYMLLAKITIVSMDKNTNKLTINSKNLISKKTEEYNLNSIVNIKMKTWHLAFTLNADRMYMFHH